MLPFLNQRKATTAIMMSKKPGEAPQPVEEAAPEAPSDLLSCAQDLIAAVKAEDAQAVAVALEAAYYACDTAGDEGNE